LKFLTSLEKIAVPQYGQYTKRAKFSEIVTSTAAVKTAVNLCFQEEGGLGTCNDGGYAGIPADITAQTGLIETLATAGNGVITATGHATELNSETYILTPTPDAANTRLTWAVTGTCVAQNLCKD